MKTPPQLQCGNTKPRAATQAMARQQQQQHHHPITATATPTQTTSTTPRTNEPEQTFASAAHETLVGVRHLRASGQQYWSVVHTGPPGTTGAGVGAGYTGGVHAAAAVTHSLVSGQQICPAVQLLPEVPVRTHEAPPASHRTAPHTATQCVSVHGCMCEQRDSDRPMH